MVGRSVLAQNIGLLLAIICVVTAGVEMILRLYYPSQLVTIGTTGGDNAKLYGWGFGPHERVIVSNPDNGEIYSDITNGRGWRDLERNFEKPAGVFRMLVLGDSNSFGALVPAHRVYTRILEADLKAQGYAVEVLNMSYGGWSTDQQLEALTQEGLKYDPDVVVLQFTSNDVGENAADGGRNRAKPFKYSLDTSGKLIREAMAVQRPDEIGHWRSIAKNIVAKSEILKRAYLVFATYSYQRPHIDDGGYRVNRNRYLLVKYRLQAGDADSFLSFLESRMNQRLDISDIDAALTRSGHAASRQAILDSLRTYWFHDYWEPDEYERKPVDPGSQPWRLTLALLAQVRERCHDIGAETWIISDQEEGAFAWERQWGRISGSADARRAFFSLNDVLLAFAVDHDAFFVPTTAIHSRALLDPHPNDAGNQAMAANLASFLVSRHGPRLPRIH